MVSCAGKLLCQQLGGTAATGGFVQQAAAATGCSGLLQKLGQSSGYATNSHDIFNIHRHSPNNNWNTEFDFTPENYKRVSINATAQQAAVAAKTASPPAKPVCWEPAGLDSSGSGASNCDAVPSTLQHSPAGAHFIAVRFASHAVARQQGCV